ncbi:MAG: glycosyltransferase family 2 protein [Chloroflexota bacterium]
MNPAGNARPADALQANQLEKQPAPPCSIGVVIPVLDEADAIGLVVTGIPRDLIAEVVVVDGGSRDGTIEVARAAGARVIVARRSGYGWACATGAAATTSDVVVFLDGDGSDDSTEIPRVVAPLLRGEADLVLGARSRVKDGAIPFYARAGNTLAAAIISLAWHQRVTDLPSFKAIGRRDLESFGMSEATYGWTIELIVKAARRKRRIREVPQVYSPRVGGVSKVSGNLRASLKAAFAILRVLVRHGLGADGGAGRVDLLRATRNQPTKGD